MAGPLDYANAPTRKSVKPLFLLVLASTSGPAGYLLAAGLMRWFHALLWALGALLGIPFFAVMVAAGNYFEWSTLGRERRLARIGMVLSVVWLVAAGAGVVLAIYGLTQAMKSI